MTGSARSRTAYLLFAAAFLLGVGSFALLLGPVLVILLRASQFLILLTGVGGSLLHFLAWIVLGQAIVVTMRSPGPWTRDARWGMAAAFLISLLGFGIAFVCMSPNSVYLLPYSPAMYVPAIAAHAIIFLIGASVLADHRTRMIVVGGSLFLLGVAFVAVAVFRSPFSDISFILFWLPGISGFGYGIVSLGWLRDYRAARRLAW